MSKEEWINQAVKYLISITGEWESKEERSYCESLYDTYIIESNDLDCDPEEAVDTDLTYWD